MIIIERIPLTWSVVFGCGWADFANLLPGKNDHDRAYSTHLVCYVWMWMGRFCKPFARKRDDDETSVFHSLGLLCLDVDGQILQTFCNENNYDDRSFCFLLLECIFDMFPFLC